MSTFAEFIVKCENRIENKNTRTTPYLKDATVRWLKELSNRRALFMESTFSFQTVAGTTEYGPGYTGFPLDAMEFQAVYREEGSGVSSYRTIIEGPRPLEDVRSHLTPGISPGYPTIWAWHHDKMIFAPLINAVMTIKGDYYKDATRDTSSGAVITTSSTTHTNPWFDRGEQLLLNAVLLDYYSAIGKDAEAASLCKGLYDLAEKSIQRDYSIKAAKSAQADWVWGSTY